jgi:type I restriction enzyme S subunit
MKDRGHIWIGELPSTWKLRRFKDAGRFQTGRDHKELKAGNVPVFGSSCEPFAMVDRPLCRRKAIAIGRKGTVDRPFVIQPGFWAVDTCMFHTVQRKDYSLEYLGYWSNIVPWQEIATQTALPSLTQTDANNVIVGYPPLDEQRRIASWLDLQTHRIDKRRELLGKKRELLRDLRINLILEVLASGLRGHEKSPTGLCDLPELPLGWTASHAKRLLRYVTSGSRGWAKYYADEGDLFLRIGNLTRETIDLDLSDVKYVALPSKAAEGKRTRLREGDMLVSITADLGSIAVAPKLNKPAYVNQHIALCRAKDSVHPRWLGYAMCSPQSKRQMMDFGYGGTKIQLSLDDVRNVWLAVPPLDEQREMAAFLDARLDKIARQIALIDQLDDLLQQQRQAIIHEAVTGKIDLSAYDPPAEMA